MGEDTWTLSIELSEKGHFQKQQGHWLERSWVGYISTGPSEGHATYYTHHIF